MTETPTAPGVVKKPLTRLQQLAELLGFNRKATPGEAMVRAQRPTLRQMKRMKSYADARAEKRRELEAKGQRDAKASQQVACCSRCQSWFPTTVARNAHRELNCPKRPTATTASAA